MKFLLVNGRTPRPQSFCALCCEPIEESYLRELTTRVSYCDHKCYVDHSKVAVPDAPKACEGVMITTDALKYLAQMGLEPSRVVSCAATKCQISFALANGFAIEAIVAEKFSIAFFCSAGCYLDEIPPNCCARV